MPTLAAEKEHLMVETQVDIVQMREKEFQYYETHLSSIETVATLLAGFAFAALLLEASPLSTSYLVLQNPTGQYTGRLNISSGTMDIDQEYAWFRAAQKVASSH